MAETLEVPATQVDASPGAARRPSVAALVVVGALVLVGLAVRLWIMTGRLGAIDSDEAITGLMARHLLDGELRAFMWRLSYQGTIVTWPVAASFWLFGSSRFTLELPFLVMSAGAAVMIWRIGLRFLSPFQAAFGALAFWLWPAIYVWISVKPLIFYVPTLVLGLAVVLCAVRVAEKPGRVADWCVLGLCAGAGWWTSPNIMYFAFPVGVWFIAFHRRALWPGVLYAAPCAVLGALPWIWNQATYGLTAFDLKEDQAQGSFLDHLGYFFTHALPTALGLRAPISGDWALGHGGQLLYVVALGLLVLALVAGVSGAVGRRGRVAVPAVRVRAQPGGVEPRHRRGGQRPLLLLLRAVPRALDRAPGATGRARRGARGRDGGDERMGLRPPVRGPRLDRRGPTARSRHRAAGARGLPRGVRELLGVLTTHLRERRAHHRRGHGPRTDVRGVRRPRAQRGESGLRDEP